VPGRLVIIPCGSAKVWSRSPDTGAVPARDAYVGPPFKVSRAFAERFGDRWLILSAKYGFIAPDFPIPGPYDVTFKEPRTDPLTVELLLQQARDAHLSDFDEAVALGGQEYRRIISEVFASFVVPVHFPFQGLNLFQAMRSTAEATRQGRLPK
jgi:hypothetical protein